MTIASSHCQQDSAVETRREIQQKGEFASSSVWVTAVQGSGILCTADQTCTGFEVLTRAMLHLEHRAVEFLPRWRVLPGADGDALMILYSLRMQLTHDYTRLRKARRAAKAAA